MKIETVQKMTTDKLKEKLSFYDNKYYEISSNHSMPGFGYGMRAYHRLKTMSFSKEDACRANGKMIKAELQKRGESYRTTFI